MRAGYYHPDLGDDPLPDDFEAADNALARKVGSFLLAYYPGHPFRAEVSHLQGVVMVRINELMGPINCYILKIDDLKTANDFDKGLHRACGEILERYRIPRNKFSGADFVAALARAPLIGLKDAPVPE